MNLVGYLITLANLQSFDRSGGPITDLQIKVAEIQSLINEFKNLPGFDLENFRKTGYYRQGKLGKYVSKNFRDYVYNGVGKPTDEAVLLTMVFNSATTGTGPATSNGPDKTLSYFLHRGEVDKDVVKGLGAYVNERNTLNHGRYRRDIHL